MADPYYKDLMIVGGNSGYVRVSVERMEELERTEELHDQLKKDMDRLLKARRRISFALSPRARYEALKNLHEVAEELEAGRKEKT